MRYLPWFTYRNSHTTYSLIRQFGCKSMIDFVYVRICKNRPIHHHFCKRLLTTTGKIALIRSCVMCASSIFTLHLFYIIWNSQHIYTSNHELRHVYLKVHPCLLAILAINSFASISKIYRLKIYDFLYNFISRYFNVSSFEKMFVYVHDHSSGKDSGYEKWNDTKNEITGLCNVNSITFLGNCQSSISLIIHTNIDLQ